MKDYSNYSNGYNRMLTMTKTRLQIAGETIEKVQKKAEEMLKRQQENNLKSQHDFTTMFTPDDDTVLEHSNETADEVTEKANETQEKMNTKRNETETKAIVNETLAKLKVSISKNFKIFQ